MKKIVFLDRSTIDPVVVIDKPDFSHTWIDYDNTEPDSVVDRLSDAHVAISKKVYLGEEVLRQLPKLEHIAVTSTGTNHVDVNYCDKHHIHVSNVKGYGAEPVSEHAMMMLLALRRNLPKYMLDISDGAWERSQLYCHYAAPLNDLAGTTLSIFGKGDIGTALGARAQAFGMRVLFAERKNASVIRPGYTPFEVALAEGDQIVICCPLNAHTRDLINAPELRVMKPDAVIVNVARGGIVNENAAVEALLTGKLAGLATDVAEFEPLRSDSPLARLKDHSRAIITPHIAWASISGQQKLMDMVIRNIDHHEAKVGKHCQKIGIENAEGIDDSSPIVLA